MVVAVVTSVLRRWGSKVRWSWSFGRGSLAVYQWVLGLAGGEEIFLLVVSMKCEMRYFVTVYDIRFGIRFWIPSYSRGVTVTFLDAD